jgi:hypothetical protein
MCFEELRVHCLAFVTWQNPQVLFQVVSNIVSNDRQSCLENASQRYSIRFSGGEYLADFIAEIWGAVVAVIDKESLRDSKGDKSRTSAANSESLTINSNLASFKL